MRRMFYVYRIQSIQFPNEVYVGITEDLVLRMLDHNQGRSPHTSKFRPWELICFLGFPHEAKARAFEKYLKSGSGRAFAKKHF